MFKDYRLRMASISLRICDNVLRPSSEAHVRERRGRRGSLDCPNAREASGQEHATFQTITVRSTNRFLLSADSAEVLRLRLWRPIGAPHREPLVLQGR